MEEKEMIERIKTWIIDTLDNTDKRNFDHNLGVVDGMERIMNWILNHNTDNDAAIHGAYERLNKRLYPKN